ncbi:transglutaminase-like cysteine peptidase [Oricola cellulosilytica]|uniref:Transglutaminase n=1 Tax=Oricola cellulosilytica TaxID=1429082 RepID=A0A4R0PAC9_9HYPH|nr:transglutaminase-like cysteine peptidase [Oricola cellulosilytica]TCD14201.1 hypothetical protein E0D97_08955 [Oricola cellulosilytica]
MTRLIALAISALIAVGCSQTTFVSSTASLGTSDSEIAFSSAFMKLDGNAFPPPAFHKFCAESPRLCATSDGSRTVELTPARIAQLKAVNVYVNNRIKEQDDRVTAGRWDDWRLPTKVGDCEDFAILKKDRLTKQGWSPAALLLTVATFRGEGHVVLTVRTDKGDYILDNRTDSIRIWSRAPYRFFARQSQVRHGKWEKIVKEI